jgi:hypothetical protein
MTLSPAGGSARQRLLGRFFLACYRPRMVPLLGAAVPLAGSPDLPRPVAELASGDEDGTYRPSTIRTHVVSRMCRDAPDHHAVTYDDLERVSPGLYRQLR